MKRVLEIKNINEDTIVVRLEATKRVKIWFKLQRNNNKVYTCESCPLYRSCSILPSPLFPKYSNFGDFCNKIFQEYPELAFTLSENYGITYIGQFVPIKIKR